MSNENKNLYYLHELPGYKVAEDYSDVRGWKVYDRNNKLVGKVDGLLVNKHAERVVYLDVEVDESLLKEGFDTFKLRSGSGVHGFLNSEGDDHVIIPIGMVALDEDNKKVTTTEIDYQTFATTKRFGKHTDITREYELEVFNYYLPEAKSGTAESDNSFYNNRQFQ